MAWCPQDADLLLSCAKDNRILCWNPNSAAPAGEVVYEIPTSHQWSFDVQWCPRNPNIISSSSFDGSVTCFSLMGGGHPIHQIDKVIDGSDCNLYKSILTGSIFFKLAIVTFSFRISEVH